MSVPLYQAKAELFRTLGHPVRIRVLELLQDGPKPVRGLLAARQRDRRSADAALVGVGTALLSPVHVTSPAVYSNADTPVARVAARGLATPGLNDRFDPGSIEIRTHDAHAFPIRPVELAIGGLERELLGGERPAGRDDGRQATAVQPHPLD